MPKRLVPLSGDSARIRWLEASVGARMNQGVIWAGCNKPKLPIQMTVTNPGTSFEQFAPATPTYKASGVNFSFPCPPKPWDAPYQQFTGRPKPLKVGQPFFRVVWDTSTLAPEFRKPR